MTTTFQIAEKWSFSFYYLFNTSEYRTKLEKANLILKNRLKSIRILSFSPKKRLK